MKLYQVPRNSLVRTKYYEFYFFNTDGSYSFCKDKKGSILHPSVLTEVESYDNNITYEEYINRKDNNPICLGCIGSYQSIL